MLVRKTLAGGGEKAGEACTLMVLLERAFGCGADGTAPWPLGEPPVPHLPTPQCFLYVPIIHG